MGRPRKNVQLDLLTDVVDELVEDVTQEVTPQVVIVEPAPPADPEVPEWLRIELEAGKAALAKLKG